MSKHAHKWRMTAHLDGCHYYTSIFACSRCSATATKTVERNVNNPMTAVWMEERYHEVRRDERGRFITPRWEVAACERCEALKAGAPIHADLVILDTNGEVESEQHSEYPA